MVPADDSLEVSAGVNCVTKGGCVNTTKVARLRVTSGDSFCTCFFWLYTCAGAWRTFRRNGPWVAARQHGYEGAHPNEALGLPRRHRSAGAQTGLGENRNAVTTVCMIMTGRNAVVDGIVEPGNGR